MITDRSKRPFVGWLSNNMKFQFPLSIGVFVAGFGAFGCGVSNAEVPSPDFWKDAAVIESDAAAPDSSTAADGGSEDGSIYGNDDASAAGAGGDHEPVGGTGGSHQPQGGSGGAGGDDEPVGGTGGDEEPVGGSGGTGGDEEPVGGSGGGDTCPTDYTMATHIVMNVTWPKTTGPFGVTVVPAGSGKVHVWSRSRFEEDGNTSEILSKSCGSTLPPIQTSAVAGNEKLLPEIPNASWDKPNMPEFPGTSTKTGNSVVASTGVALVGLTMSNPTATWPSRTTIMGVDHDSDGFAGLAAIPKTTDGFSAVPLDIGREQRADRVDLAIRTVMTLNSTVEGCPENYTGTANVSKFENHIIGCHVKGGGECNDTQKKFVDDNRTVYSVTSATFTAKRVSDDASCADVRAALP
jgi:hypothetical protein